MDETGRPADAAPQDDGNEADPRDQSWHSSGWARAGGTWSEAGPSEPDREAVRSPWQPVGTTGAGAWADQSARYTGLLPPLAAAPTQKTRHTANGVSHQDRRPEEPLGERQAPETGPRAADAGPPVAEAGPRISDAGPPSARFPASAPPYPYEGDRADGAREYPTIPHPRQAPPSPPEAGEKRLEALGNGASDAQPERPEPGPTPGRRARGDAEEPGRRARGDAEEPARPGGRDVANSWAPGEQVPERPAAPGRLGEEPAAVPAAGRGVPDENAGWARPPDYGTAERASRDSTEDWSPDWARRAAARSADGAAPAAYRPGPGPATPGNRSGSVPGNRPGSGDPAVGPAPHAAPEEPAAAAVGAHAASDRARSDAEAAGASTHSTRRAERPATINRPALPQRIPAEPDVPTVPEPPVVDPAAETPELTRIASHLRREDPLTQAHERPEGFDVNAILAAVRGVPGVRDASLRTTPAGAHSLRLDLADGADPAEVSRQVARLLQERMGLAAAPQNLPGEAAAGSPPPTADHPAERSGRRWSTYPGSAQPEAFVPRRRRQVAPSQPPGGEYPAGPTFRGAVSGVGGAGNPAPVAAAHRGGRAGTEAPSRPLRPGERPGPRAVIDHVQVSTFGLDATVEVRLAAGQQRAVGLATGPAVDGYMLRLCAAAAASAVGELLDASERLADRGRCFVEHAAVVPLGNCEVAVVVVLLMCGGWVEQLVGSALVAGDPRQAVVRATLSAVNRRLEALLA